MKVLVCGGRQYGEFVKGKPKEMTFREQQHVFITLYDRGITEVIEGGAPGADRCARRWATENYIPVTTVRADWDKHGLAAGPIRNSEMLKLEPALVIAFAGGSGTADMVRKAKAAGIPVLEVPTINTP